MSFGPPIDGAGGGGGGQSSPILVISPSPVNFGTVVQSVNGSVTVTLKALYLGVTVNSVVTSDPDFTITGFVPDTFIAQGNSSTFTVTVNKAALGAASATLTITDTTDASPHVVNMTVTIITTGSGLFANPASLTFAEQPINARATLTFDLHNPTGSDIQINSFAFNNLPQFVGVVMFSSPQAFPFTVTAGNFVTVSVVCGYAILGVITSTLVITAQGGATLSVPLTSDATLFFLGTGVLQNTLRAIILGFSQPINKQLNQGNSNSELANTLVFNGSLWDRPGNEKQLERIEVFYENVGVCTGLTATVQSWRSALTPPAYDTATQTITLGDASADGKELSAFFDLTMTGELIILTITRSANSGPLSLIGFIPHFVEKGEKVEST